MLSDDIGESFLIITDCSMCYVQQDHFFFSLLKCIQKDRCKSFSLFNIRHKLAFVIANHSNTQLLPRIAGYCASRCFSARCDRRIDIKQIKHFRQMQFEQKQSFQGLN